MKKKLKGNKNNPLRLLMKGKQRGFIILYCFANGRILSFVFGLFLTVNFSLKETDAEEVNHIYQAIKKAFAENSVKSLYTEASKIYQKRYSHIEFELSKRRDLISEIYDSLQTREFEKRINVINEYTNNETGIYIGENSCNMVQFYLYKKLSKDNLRHHFLYSLLVDGFNNDSSKAVFLKKVPAPYIIPGAGYSSGESTMNEFDIRNEYAIVRITNFNGMSYRSDYGLGEKLIENIPEWNDKELEKVRQVEKNIKYLVIEDYNFYFSKINNKWFLTAISMIDGA